MSHAKPPLDEYIIEEIKRREDEKRKQEDADRPRKDINDENPEVSPEVQPENKTPNEHDVNVIGDSDFGVVKVIRDIHGENTVSDSYGEVRLNTKNNFN